MQALFYLQFRKMLEEATLLMDSSDSDSELEDFILCEWNELTTPIRHVGHHITEADLVDTEAVRVIDDYRFTEEHIEQMVHLLNLPQFYIAPNGTKASGSVDYKYLIININLLYCCIL